VPEEILSCTLRRHIARMILDSITGDRIMIDTDLVE
jgi:hypothetical protein